MSIKEQQQLILEAKSDLDTKYHDTYLREEDICESLPGLYQAKEKLLKWKKIFEDFVNDSGNSVFDLSLLTREIAHLNKRLANVNDYINKGSSSSCTIMGGKRHKSRRHKSRRHKSRRRKSRRHKSRRRKSRRRRY